MAEKPQEEQHRWTATRRVALVLSIMKGETSIQEAGMGAVSMTDSSQASTARYLTRAMSRWDRITKNRERHFVWAQEVGIRASLSL